MIWSFQSGDYEERRFLGRGAMQILFTQDQHDATSQKKAFFEGETVCATI
jgi:hypothetical protein